MKGLVSVVILTYNGKEFFDIIMPTLYAQTYDNVEIVVVDNNSTDGSAEYVKKNYPNVVLVENKENRGYCGGNNDGINVAKGEYIVIINDDNECDPDWLSEAIKVMESDPKVGVVGVKVLRRDDRISFDTAGVNLNKDCSVLIRGFGEKDHGQYDEACDVFSGAGNGVIFRRKMLDDIGLFDEDFWAHYDETDLCFRARLRGWKVMYAPKAVIYHIKYRKTGFGSLGYIFYGERNRIWTMVKSAPLRIILKSPYYTIKRLLKEARTNTVDKYNAVPRVKIFFTIVKAWGSAIIGMPKMIRKRAEIQKTKQINTKQILEFFQ